MNGVRNVKFSFGPGEGSKGQILFNFNCKVNFKDFIPNIVCDLTNEDTKHIRQVLYSVAWVMPQGWNLWVLRGQNQILSCCLSVMLSPPELLDEIQPNLVCELLT